MLYNRRGTHLPLSTAAGSRRGSRGTTARQRHILQGALAFPTGVLFGLHAGVSLAGPQGGDIAAGSGQISRPDASTTQIHQRSDKLIVNWESFNVSAQERVNFLQPSSSAAALNRIWDQNPSQIHGQIRANGKVLLVNPSGVIFGKSAVVKVNSLVASGLNISDADFLSGGKDTFFSDHKGGGAVINRGLLEASVGGSVSLLGGGVSNEGRIVATAGEVTLAAGNRMTMDFDGDGLLRFAVTEEVMANTKDLDAAVSNSGQIEAAGGEVLLSGRAARQVFSEVVNNSGVIQASAVEHQGGKVRLVAQGAGSTLVNTGRIEATSKHKPGGEIKISSDGDARIAAGSSLAAGTIAIDAKEQLAVADSTLTVSNQQRSGKKNEKVVGGRIALTGKQVALTGKTKVLASGQSGGGNIAVGGGYQGKDASLRNSRSTKIGAGVRLVADGVTGDGGQVVVWSDGATDFQGAISARARQVGDGGVAEISGKEYLNLGSVDVDLSGAGGGSKGSLLLDPENITIIDSNKAADADLNGDGTKGDDASGNIASGDNPGKTSIITNKAVNSLLTKADLTLVATETISVNGQITVSTGTSNLALNANTININARIFLQGSKNSLTFTARSGIYANTSDIITTGTQTYNGQFVLLADLKLRAGPLGSPDDVTFNGNVVSNPDNSNNYSLSANANVITGKGVDLGAEVVGKARANTYLDFLDLRQGTTSLGGNVFTSDAQAYSSITLREDATFLQATDITFFGSSSGIHVNGGGKTLQLMVSNSITTLSGAAYRNLGSLTVGGGANVTIVGDITTTGVQQYDNLVILQDQSSNDSIKFTAKDGDTLRSVTFNGGVITNPLTNRGDSLVIDGNLVTGSGSDLGAKVSSRPQGNTRLGSLSVTGTSRLSGKVTTQNRQTYTGRVTLLDDVTLTSNSNIVILSAGIDGGGKDLTVDVNGGVTLNGDAATNFFNIADLSVTSRANNIFLRGNIITSGNQEYSSAVGFSDRIILLSDVRLVAGTADKAANVTFRDGVVSNPGNSDNYSLTIGSSTVKTNLLTSSQGIGSVAPSSVNAYLNTLSVSGDTESLGNIFTRGSQTYGGRFVLDNDQTLTASDSGSLETITFNGDVSSPDSGTNPNVTIAGNLVTASGVKLGLGSNDPAASILLANTRLGNLSVVGTSSLGGNVLTAGSQTWGGKITLTGDVSFDGTDGNFATSTASDISIDGGGNALTLLFSGNTSFNFTGLENLSSLTVAGGGNTFIDDDITTTGAQQYDDLLILRSSVTLTAKNGDVSSTVTFNNKVVSNPTNNSNYALNIDGNLVTGSSGELGAAVASTPRSNTNLDQVSVSGSSRLSANITTNRIQTYTDQVVLLADVVLSANDGTDLADVNFGGVVSNPDNSNNYDLTIDGNLVTRADMGVMIAGKARANTYLGDVSVSGNSRLSGNISSSNSGTGVHTFKGEVTLTRAVTLRGLSGDFEAEISGGGNGLTLLYSGDSMLQGNLSGISTLTVAGGGNTEIQAAKITTTGAQQYDDLVILNPATAVTLTAKDGSTLSTVTFNGDVVSDARFSTQAGLTIAGNLVTGSGGELGAEVPGINRANTYLATLSVTGTSRLSANVATGNTSSQTYDGKVTLLGDVTFRGQGATFTGGLDGGGKDLTLMFQGDTTLDGSTATFSNIADLNVEGAGSVFLSGTITTSGNQLYDTSINNLIILRSDTNLIAGTADKAARVQFFNPVVSNPDNAANYSLTIGNNTIKTNLDTALNSVGPEVTGKMRANTYLNNLSVSGNSRMEGTVSTSGSQTYGGQFMLAGNVTLFANGSGTLQTVTFNGDVGSITNASNYNLTIDGNLVTASGVKLGFGDPDSSATALFGTILNSVRVTGNSSLGGNVLTTFGQTFTGKVTLTGDVSFRGQSGTFSGGIDGGGNGLGLLFSANTVLDSTGAATFSNISSLTTGGGGNTIIGTDITTSGAQQYDDFVILTKDVTLTAKEGSTRNSITFNGGAVSNTENSANYDLTIDGNLVTGVRSQLGADQANSYLGDLSVQGSSSLGSNVLSSDSSTQTYDGKVTLTGDVSLRGQSGTFSNGVDGGGKVLRLLFSADTTLDGADFTNLGGLTVAGGGNTTISTDITTTGAQSYENDVVILGADVTLTAKDGATLSTVTFSGKDVISNPTNTNNYDLTVDGNLVVASGVDVGLDNIAGTVAANVYLGDLSVTGNTTLADSVATSGQQTYGGLLILEGNITLEANNSGTLQTITLNGDVVSNPDDDSTWELEVRGNLVTGTGAELGAAVEGKDRANTYLSSVTVTGTSQLAANVSTSDDSSFTAATGVQLYTGKVTLLGDVNFAGVSGTFSGGFDGGNNALGLLFSQDSTLDSKTLGAFENISSLTIGGGGNTTISTDITTTGNQRYDDLIILTRDTTLTAKIGERNPALGTFPTLQTITLNNDVISNPATDLSYQLNIDGNLVLGSDADLGVKLPSVAHANTMLLNFRVFGSSRLGGGTITSRFDVAFDGTVTLLADTSLNANTVRMGAAVTSNSDNADNYDLTIDGKLNVVATGRLGVAVSGGGSANQSLGDLSVTGTANIASNVYTAGSQTWDSKVTLQQRDITFSGTEGTFSGGLDGGGKAVNLLFSGDSSLAGGFSNISTLTVAGGGETTVAGNITTTGAQQYDDQVILAADTVFTAKQGDTLSTVTFNANVANKLPATVRYDFTVDGNLVTATGKQLGKTADGTDASFGDLSVTGTSVLSMNVRTSGAQTWDGKVTLEGDSDQTLVLENNAGNLVFSGGIDGGGRKIELSNFGASGAKTLLEGNVANVANLTVSTARGTSQLFIKTGRIQTIGTQTYSVPVILQSNVVLIAGTAENPSTITVETSLGSDSENTTNYNLTIGSSSIKSVYVLSTFSDIGDAADANTWLGTFMVNGNLRFNNSGAANIYTSGTQTYNGQVQLRGALLLSANDGGTLQTITLNDNAFSNLPGGSSNYALTIDGNLVTGTGVELGEDSSLPIANTRLSTLSVIGTSQLSGNVVTSGVQTYDGKVTLSSDVNFSGTSGTFSGGFDGGGNALGLLFSANTVLDSTGLAVFQNIGSLTTGGGGNTIISTDITTTGNQQYDDRVILTKAVTLTAKDGSTLGSVTFNGDVVSNTENSANYDLTIDGNLVTGSRLGTAVRGVAANTDLGNLSVKGSSRLVGNVSSSGKSTQVYDGKVTLLEDTTFLGGRVTFSGGVDGGGKVLTLTNSERTVLDADFENLGGLTVNGSRGVQISTDITTTGAQNYATVVRLFSDVTLIAGSKDSPNTVTIDGFSRVTVRSNPDNAENYSLTIGSADIATNLMGIPVGEGNNANTYLNNLVVWGSTRLDSTGGSFVNVFTTGSQTYHGQLVLVANTRLSANNSGTRQSVTFNAVVVSDPGNGTNYDLTIDGNLMTGSAGELGAEVEGNTRANTYLSNLSVIGSSRLSANVSTSDTGTQTYDEQVTLLANVNFRGQGATFSKALDGGNNTLGLFFAGDTTLDGDFLNTYKNIGSLTIDGGGNTMISTDITTTGTQEYRDLVILTKDTTLKSNTSTVIFRNNVISDPGNADNYDLTIDGNLQVFSNLGAEVTGIARANTDLANLSVTGNTTLGGNVFTRDTQRYEGLVILENDIVLTAKEGSTLKSIQFREDVRSATGSSDNYDLTIDGNLTVAAEDVELGVAVVGEERANTLLGNVSVSGTSFLAKSRISTSGTQTYTGKVTLGGDVSFAGSSGTFTGGVDGKGNALGLLFSEDTVLDSSGLAVFTGISSLTTGGGGNTIISTDITTTGKQQYDDLVILTKEVTLTAKDGSTLSSVTFNGSVVSNTENTDNYDLTVDGNLVTGKNSILGVVPGSVISANALLGNVSVTGSSRLALGVYTNASATQVYDGQVILLGGEDDDEVTFSGKTGTFSGGIDGGGKSLRLLFSDDTVLDSTFGSSLQNIAGLSVGGGGNTIISTDITTTGVQQYEDLVILRSDVTLIAGTAGKTSAVNFLSQVVSDPDNSNNYSLTVGSASIKTELTLSSLISSNGTLVLSNLGSEIKGKTRANTLLSTLSVTGATILSGNVFTSGTQTYDGKMQLTTNTLLAANNGGSLQSITFNGNVISDPDNAANYDLTVDGNLVTGSGAELGAEVTGVIRANTLLGDLSVTGSSRLAGNVSSNPLTGTQTYDGKVTLTGDVSFVGMTGTFTGGVDGGGNTLGLSFSSDITLDGTTYENIGSLTVASGGNTIISTDITTTGNQEYGGLVILTKAVTLTAVDGVTLNSVTFNNNVVSNPDNSNNYVLSVKGNLVTGPAAELGAEVTGKTRANTYLADLSVSGSSRLASNVSVSNEQSYIGRVTLLGNVSFTGTTVNFRDEVFSDPDNADNYDFTVDGTLTTARELGGGGANTLLGNVSVTGSSVLGGNVSSSGTQTYDTGVTLTSSVNFRGTSATFTGGVDGGGNALGLLFSEDTVLDSSSLGTFSSISSLTVGGGGNTIISSNIETTGAQQYDDLVILRSDVKLTAKDGSTLSSVTFNGDVVSNTENSDNYDLTVDGNLVTGKGAELGAEVTGKTRANTLLADVSVTGSSRLAGNVSTSNTQVYDGRVTLTSDVTFAGKDGTFSGGFDGGGKALGLLFSADTVLDSSGLATFANIGSLTTGGGGNTIISTDITTTGAQQYDDTVILRSDVTLTATTVTFTKDVQADSSLTVRGRVIVGKSANPVTITVAETARLFGGLAGDMADTNLQLSGNFELYYTDPSNFVLHNLILQDGTAPATISILPDRSVNNVPQDLVLGSGGLDLSGVSFSDKFTGHLVIGGTVSDRPQVDSNNVLRFGSGSDAGDVNIGINKLTVSADINVGGGSLTLLSSEMQLDDGLTLTASGTESVISLLALRSDQNAPDLLFSDPATDDSAATRPEDYIRVNTGGQERWYNRNAPFALGRIQFGGAAAGDGSVTISNVSRTSSATAGVIILSDLGGEAAADFADLNVQLGGGSLVLGINSDSAPTLAPASNARYAGSVQRAARSAANPTGQFGIAHRFASVVEMPMPDGGTPTPDGGTTGRRTDSAEEDARRRSREPLRNHQDEEEYVQLLNTPEEDTSLYGGVLEVNLPPEWQGLTPPPTSDIPEDLEEDLPADVQDNVTRQRIRSVQRRLYLLELRIIGIDDPSERAQIEMEIRTLKQELQQLETTCNADDACPQQEARHAADDKNYVMQHEALSGKEKNYVMLRAALRSKENKNVMLRAAQQPRSTHLLAPSAAAHATRNQLQQQLEQMLAATYEDIALLENLQSDAKWLARISVRSGELYTARSIAAEMEQMLLELGTIQSLLSALAVDEVPQFSAEMGSYEDTDRVRFGAELDLTRPIIAIA